ncbi:NADH dehydrogenase [ubiquinone] 1 alpha subcomplex assembly factor 3 [Batrachochytrium dendrobatidis]|nr:NADH dehydrogenase [ubiquinone] 1 alpha subcomplex assembly factor 3 [Batrachochytrium dendrobatidis]
MFFQRYRFKLPVNTLALSNPGPYSFIRTTPIVYTRIDSVNVSTTSKPTTESLLQKYQLFGTPSNIGKMVTSVSNNGFVCKDLKVVGPGLIINNTVLLWDVPQYGLGGPEGEFDAQGNSTAEKHVGEDQTSPIFYGWSTDMLKIFKVVDPTPDILVIGTGAKMERLPLLLRDYLVSLGIQIEVLTSTQAASTYNVLLQEGRRPAVALLPAIPTSARTGKALVNLLKKEELDGLMPPM